MGSRMLWTIALLLVTCSPTPGPEPVPVPPPPPPDSDPCLSAEKRLRQLDCRREDGSSWTTTPGGTPFGVACARAEIDGRNWNPECIATIIDCSELEAAYRGELCQ